jgi:hypothetical protein
MATAAAAVMARMVVTGGRKYSARTSGISVTDTMMFWRRITTLSTVIWAAIAATKATSPPAQYADHDGSSIQKATREISASRAIGVVSSQAYSDERRLTCGRPLIALLP